MNPAGRFTSEEERRLAESFRDGRPLLCPRCRLALDERPIRPRPDVSYVRNRLWLVCASCGRTAVLERRVPD